jgi:lauroyl/myristoyl acyltransferase
MNIRELMYSRLGPSLGILLARILSAKQAYALAEYMARRLARQSDSRLARAIRSNQATVRELPLDDPALDDAVLQVLRVSAIAHADLFRSMAQGVEAVKETSTLDERLWDYLEAARGRGTGLIAVGGHLVGFDSILLTLKSHGLEVQALAAAELHGAYRVQNFIRRRYGLDVTPVSYRSLRQALQNIKSGGILLTGVDFPVPGGDSLRFFGRTTRLPAGHARLALSTQAPVVVALPEKTDLPGHYHVRLMPPMYPERTGDQRRDTLVFAQKILFLIEDCIRERPGEWLMFNPLWPEDLGESRL